MARLRLVFNTLAVASLAIPLGAQAQDPVPPAVSEREREALRQRVADEVAVLTVVLDLFEAMRTRDEALLRSVWHPDARLQTVIPAESEGRDVIDGSALRTTAIDDFVASVLSGSAELDEVTFDEVIEIDGDLATVWAPYNLFVDGTFSHCGVDAIQLVRTPDAWRIHQLTDTRRRTGCDPERRGD